MYSNTEGSIVPKTIDYVFGAQNKENGSETRAVSRQKSIEQLTTFYKDFIKQNRFKHYSSIQCQRGAMLQPVIDLASLNSLAFGTYKLVLGFRVIGFVVKAQRSCQLFLQQDVTLQGDAALAEVAVFSSHDISIMSDKLSHKYRLYSNRSIHIDALSLDGAQCSLSLIARKKVHFKADSTVTLGNCRVVAGEVHQRAACDVYGICQIECEQIHHFGFSSATKQVTIDAHAMKSYEGSFIHSPGSVQLNLTVLHDDGDTTCNHYNLQVADARLNGVMIIAKKAEVQCGSTLYCQSQMKLIIDGDVATVCHSDLISDGHIHQLKGLQVLWKCVIDPQLSPTQQQLNAACQVSALTSVDAAIRLTPGMRAVHVPYIPHQEPYQHKLYRTTASRTREITRTYVSGLVDDGAHMILLSANSGLHLNGEMRTTSATVYLKGQKVSLAGAGALAKDLIVVGGSSTEVSGAYVGLSGMHFYGCDLAFRAGSLARGKNIRIVLSGTKETEEDSEVIGEQSTIIICRKGIHRGTYKGKSLYIGAQTSYRLSGLAENDNQQYVAGVFYGAGTIRAQSLKCQSYIHAHIGYTSMRTCNNDTFFNINPIFFLQTLTINPSATQLIITASLLGFSTAAYIVPNAAALINLARSGVMLVPMSCRISHMLWHLGHDISATASPVLGLATASKIKNAAFVLALSAWRVASSFNAFSSASALTFSADTFDITKHFDWSKFASETGASVYSLASGSSTMTLVNLEAGVLFGLGHFNVALIDLHTGLLFSGTGNDYSFLDFNGAKSFYLGSYMNVGYEHHYTGNVYSLYGNVIDHSLHKTVIAPDPLADPTYAKWLIHSDTVEANDEVTFVDSSLRGTHLIVPDRTKLMGSNTSLDFDDVQGDGEIYLTDGSGLVTKVYINKGKIRTNLNSVFKADTLRNDGDADFKKSGVFIKHEISHGKMHKQGCLIKEEEVDTFGESAVDASEVHIGTLHDHGAARTVIERSKGEIHKHVIDHGGKSKVVGGDMKFDDVTNHGETEYRQGIFKIGHEANYGDSKKYHVALTEDTAENYGNNAIVDATAHIGYYQDHSGGKSGLIDVKGTVDDMRAAAGSNTGIYNSELTLKHHNFLGKGNATDSIMHLGPGRSDLLGHLFLDHTRVYNDVTGVSGDARGAPRPAQVFETADGNVLIGGDQNYRFQWGVFALPDNINLTYESDAIDVSGPILHYGPIQFHSLHGDTRIHSILIMGDGDVKFISARDIILGATRILGTGDVVIDAERNVYSQPVVTIYKSSHNRWIGLHFEQTYDQTITVSSLSVDIAGKVEIVARQGRVNLQSVHVSAKRGVDIFGKQGVVVRDYRGRVTHSRTRLGLGYVSGVDTNAEVSLGSELISREGDVNIHADNNAIELCGTNIVTPSRAHLSAPKILIERPILNVDIDFDDTGVTLTGIGPVRLDREVGEQLPFSGIGQAHGLKKGLQIIEDSGAAYNQFQMLRNVGRGDLSGFSVLSFAAYLQGEHYHRQHLGSGGLNVGQLNIETDSLELKGAPELQYDRGVFHVNQYTIDPVQLRSSVDTQRVEVDFSVTPAGTVSIDGVSEMQSHAERSESVIPIYQLGESEYHVNHMALNGARLIHRSLTGDIDKLTLRAGENTSDSSVYAWGLGSDSLSLVSEQSDSRLHQGLASSFSASGANTLQIGIVAHDARSEAPQAGREVILAETKDESHHRRDGITISGVMSFFSTREPNDDQISQLEIKVNRDQQDNGIDHSHSYSFVTPKLPPSLLAILRNAHIKDAIKAVITSSRLPTPAVEEILEEEEEEDDDMLSPTDSEFEGLQGSVSGYLDPQYKMHFEMVGSPYEFQVDSRYDGFLYDPVNRYHLVDIQQHFKDRNYQYVIYDAFNLLPSVAATQWGSYYGEYTYQHMSPTGRTRFNGGLSLLLHLGEMAPQGRMTRAGLGFGLRAISFLHGAIGLEPDLETIIWGRYQKQPVVYTLERVGFSEPFSERVDDVVSLAVLHPVFSAIKDSTLLARRGFFSGGNTAPVHSPYYLIHQQIEEARGVTSSRRQLVLHNLMESRRARFSSNFRIHLARENQILHGYLPDDMYMTSLYKGDTLYGGLPGQTSFYTNADTLLEEANVDGRIFRSLQTRPHRSHGYRHSMGVYKVERELRVPTGQALANKQLGPGGAQQFFVRHFDKDLTLTDELRLENEAHQRLPSSKPRP